MRCSRGFGPFGSRRKLRTVEVARADMIRGVTEIVEVSVQTKGVRRERVSQAHL